MGRWWAGRAGAHRQTHGHTQVDRHAPPSPLLRSQGHVSDGDWQNAASTPAGRGEETEEKRKRRDREEKGKRREKRRRRKGKREGEKGKRRDREGKEKEMERRAAGAGDSSGLGAGPGRWRCRRGAGEGPGRAGSGLRSEGREGKRWAGRAAGPAGRETGLGPGLTVPGRGTRGGRCVSNKGQTRGKGTGGPGPRGREMCSPKDKELGETSPCRAGRKSPFCLSKQVVSAFTSSLSSVPK